MAKKMTFKIWFKDQRMWITLITMILGVLFLIASMSGLWFEDLNKGIIEDFTSSLKQGESDWNWWIFLGSVVAVIAGGGYFIDFIKKKKEFAKLIDTNSKKAFLEKQDEIELLAYKLGTPYEDMVDEKITQLRIKR